MEQCKEVLQQFKLLRSLSIQHSALVGRELLADYQFDLHLPCLHGDDDAMRAAIPTGRR